MSLDLRDQCARLTLTGPRAAWALRRCWPQARRLLDALPGQALIFRVKPGPLPAVTIWPRPNWLTRAALRIERKG